MRTRKWLVKSTLPPLVIPADAAQGAHWLVAGQIDSVANISFDEIKRRLGINVIKATNRWLVKEEYLNSDCIRIRNDVTKEDFIWQLWCP